MIKDFSLPHDPSTNVLRYVGVPYGTQVIINTQGSDSQIVVVNPSDGRKPYFYYRTKDFSDEIELPIENEEE